MHKNTNNEEKVPKALRDTWSWKDAVYRETENMDLAQSLAHIHASVESTKKAAGLKTAAPVAATADVAEPQGKYTGNKQA